MKTDEDRGKDRDKDSSALDSPISSSSLAERFIQLRPKAVSCNVLFVR
jgi:hypothetical protein